MVEPAGVVLAGMQKTGLGQALQRVVALAERHQVERDLRQRAGRHLDHRADVVEDGDGVVGLGLADAEVDGAGGMAKPRMVRLGQGADRLRGLAGLEQGDRPVQRLLSGHRTSLRPAGSVAPMPPRGRNPTRCIQVDRLRLALPWAWPGWCSPPTFKGNLTRRDRRWR
ncbi:MAG: hypothetical protein IT563_14680 [Alphaproteobacteria bacterium]|nr:hypothetical protein [Alphaproteobacteria bacterium]